MEHQNVKTSKISWKFALCWAVIPGNPYSIGVRMAPKRGFLPESRCLEVSIFGAGSGGSACDKNTASSAVCNNLAVEGISLTKWQQLMCFFQGRKVEVKKKDLVFGLSPAFYQFHRLVIFSSYPGGHGCFDDKGKDLSDKVFARLPFHRCTQVKSSIYIYNIHWVTFINFIGTQNTCHISNHRWYLKQAGACGRRPGQFPGAGVSVPKWKPIHRTHIVQPCLWRPRNHENYTLGFLFF